MASKPKISRFSKRYDLFLSEASNEEIVSISKELSDDMSNQIRTINSTAIALLGISMVSMIFTITLVADLSSTISSGIRNMIFLMRMISIAFMCMTALVTYLVIKKVSDASSVSTLAWRHIRETATDENAYEQIDAVRTINFAISSARSLNVTAVLTLIIAAFCLGMSYIYQMMAAAGYL